MSEETTSITPTRPYMVRALYQWIEDNALTPYLMVDATADNVQVPKEHVQDGRIVLNIASRATGNMSMENDYIHFSARFGGVSQEIWVPLTAVMGIYAKENSQGMFLTLMNMTIMNLKRTLWQVAALKPMLQRLSPNVIIKPV